MNVEEVNLKEKYMDKYCNVQLTGKFLEDLNPLTKLNIFLVLAISGLLLPNYKYTFVLYMFCYVVAVAGGKVKKVVPALAIYGIATVASTIVIRQLSMQGPTVMFSIFGWAWTWEALENALELGITLITFSSPIILMFVFTEIRDLMYALENKGVSHVVSYVILASVQTIIDLKKNAQTILESQRARGIETEGNAIRRVKAFLPIISPLLLSAISATEEKTIAMDARAFSIKADHTFLRELRPAPTSEKILVIGVNICFLILLAIIVLG